MPELASFELGYNIRGSPLAIGTGTSPLASTVTFAQVKISVRAMPDVKPVLASESVYVLPLSPRLERTVIVWVPLLPLCITRVFSS
jgi:hypothetical protein